MGPEHLDFELPFTSKFLLLAAYVCSRNKPAIDRRLFDPSSRARRRLGAMASDKQVIYRDSTTPAARLPSLVPSRALSKL